MLILNFTPFPLLLTDRLLLREVHASDVESIFLLRSDPGLLKYLDKTPAKHLDEASEFIQRVKKNRLEGDGILWGITLKDDTTIIGTICFWRMEKEHYRAEIGYILHSDYQGRGIMQEALRVVLKYGFETMHLHSVEANVNPGNQASIRLLEKAGFIREGYFKENYYYNGQFIDSAIYSKLSDK